MFLNHTSICIVFMQCLSSVQAMDLYYHSESDPDNYCWPGDSSKLLMTNLLFCILLLLPISYFVFTHLIHPSPSVPGQYLHFCLLSPSMHHQLPLQLSFPIQFCLVFQSLSLQHTHICTYVHSLCNLTFRSRLFNPTSKLLG